MKRIVEPELLDELPPDDVRAIHSRGDLRRLNWLMGHAAILRSILTTSFQRPPEMIAEIGAGDGDLMLQLAGQLHAKWPGVRVLLVDMQSVVGDTTLKSFRECGWQAEVMTADVFDWANSVNRMDVVIANLFLHHFPDGKLEEMFRSLANKTDLFVACEPHRDQLSLCASRLLGLIGCNAVTRHDAPVSVKAGFAGGELSALWPAANGWKLSERLAGAFSHLFVAQRKV